VNDEGFKICQSSRWRGTVLARRMGVEKGVDLLLEDVVLEGAQELFSFGQTQPEMLNALVVFIEGDDIGNSFFLTIIVTNDELQFDAHSRASPGLSGR
jgi:hypothetical protein